MKKVISLTVLLLFAISVFSAENLVKQPDSNELKTSKPGNNEPFSRATGTVKIVNSYDLNIFGITEGFHGLTYDWDGDALWISRQSDDKMWQINKNDGSYYYQADFQGSYPSLIYGLAYAEKSGDLYKIYASTGGNNLYKFNWWSGQWEWIRGGKGAGLGWDLVNDVAYTSGSNQCWWAQPSETGSWNSWVYYGMFSYPVGIACSYHDITPSNKIFVICVWSGITIDWFQNNNGIPGDKIISYNLPDWMTYPRDCAFDGRYVYVIESSTSPDKIAVLDVFVPAAPDYLTAEVTPENNIELNWQNVPREVGYRIYRSSGPPNWIYAEIDESPTGTDENYVTDYDLHPDYPWVYYYKVTAYNSWGESDFSPVAQETTLIIGNARITGIDFQPLAGRTKISWKFLAGAYEIDYIDWYKTSYMPTTPSINDFYYWMTLDDPPNNWGHFFHLSVPPQCWWIGYRGIFYTKYGYPSIPFETQYAIKHRPVVDPIIVATADTFATAYSNSRKIIVDINDRMHITYTSNDTVYYVYSDDCQTFSKSFPIGNGRYPGIAFDGKEYPHICWTAELNGGYMLCHSKLTTSGWTEPDELLGETKGEYTPASFDIDKTENVAHLTWADFPVSGNKWYIYKGSFSLLDTTPQIVPVPYDSAVQMTPESPNYLCDQEKVEGYLLWEKEGEVYAGVEYEDGTFQEMTNISNSLNPSIHPNLNVWGDSLYAVWQEEYPFGSKIFFTKRSTKIRSNWETPVELTFFPDTVEFPVCHGPYILASGKTPNKVGHYDIYALRNDEFGDFNYIHQITETRTKSKYPAACFTQHFPQQKLYVVWTEDTTKIKGDPVGWVKAQMELGTIPIPIKAANLGDPDGSPYTVQREGFKTFGNLAFKSVDYHPQELVYRFTDLKPSERYKLKLIFYYEEEGEITKRKKWKLKVKVDGSPLGNVTLISGKQTYFEEWIPFSTHQDRIVEVSIRRKKGQYAVCSEIFLYEYQSAGKGTQIAENKKNFSERIHFIAPKPNPFNNSTKVGFAIHTKEKVSLKIYDASGRLYKTLVNKKLDAGSYYYYWDGKGEGAKRSVSGVYFSVLKVGEKKFVKKIVKIK